MQKSNKMKSLRNSRNKENKNKPKGSKQGVLSRNNGTSTMRSASVATAMVRTMPSARISNGRDSTRIVHREYLTDIYSYATFGIDKTYSINPGSRVCFPWLSAIAARYESYRFNRLAFCYETTSATSVAGSVILAVDYDASDPAPLSKSVMLSYKDAVRASPWEMVKFKCDISDLTKRHTYYTRVAAVPSGTDPKLYDLGILYVGSAGGAGGTVIGELYVEYDVVLMTPQIDDTMNSLQIFGNGAITRNLPFGNAPMISGQLPYTILNTNVAGVTFLQPGDYILTYVVVGTGMSDAPAYTIGTGCTAHLASALKLADSTAVMLVYGIRTTTTRGYFSLSTAAAFTTVTSCRVFISEMDYDDVLDA